MSVEMRKLWEHAGGQLPADWTLAPLESLLLDSKSIAVGVMYPGPDTPGGTPLIKVGDIKDGAVIRPSYCISAATDQEHRRTKLMGDELLITLVGNPGECVVVSPEMAGWNPARAIAVIRLQDTSLRTYLKTVLESTAGRHLIDAVLNTTVQKTLNLKDIRKLPIPMPTDVEIKWISGISEALTKRITLLRETNATLESIAQALFKSWFVDFDPVRAKMAGRPPEGMDEATAALFPDGFEQSELGMVPRGWRVAKIGDICTLGRGSSPRPIQNFMGNDVPWIKIADATASDGMFVFTTKEKIRRDGASKSVAVGHGDLIMSNSASCGIPVFVEMEGCIHDGWLYFKNFTGVSKILMFYWLRHISEHLINIADGSVQKNLNIGLVSRQAIICPIQPLIEAFDAINQPLLDRIRDNCLQAQTLATLRDTLLPRLISGQLRLPEAEAALEEA